MHKKAGKIHTVLERLREGNKLYQAVKVAGINKATWYKWEKKLPRLEKLRRKVEELCIVRRVEMAEDALLKCAIGGSRLGMRRTYYPNGQVKTEQETWSSPNPIALIFFLTNRDPDQWKDKRALVNNTNVFAPRTEAPHERKFANEEHAKVADRLRRFLADHT